MRRDALAAGAEGWLIKRATVLERWLLVLGGLCLVYTSPQTDAIGIALIGLAAASQFVRKTPPVSLPELRTHAKLKNMRILQRGNRLSVTPVDPADWDYLEALFKKPVEKR